MYLQLFKKNIYKIFGMVFVIFIKYSNNQFLLLQKILGFISWIFKKIQYFFYFIDVGYKIIGIVSKIDKNRCKFDIRNL